MVILTVKKFMNGTGSLNHEPWKCHKTEEVLCVYAPCNFHHSECCNVQVTKRHLIFPMKIVGPPRVWPIDVYNVCLYLGMETKQIVLLGAQVLGQT